MSSSTTAAGLLLDMDGTLIESTPAVLATWNWYAKEYNLDLSEVLQTSHGVRTRDNIQRWCGIQDEGAIQTATEHFENMIVAEAKRLQDEGNEGLILLPGVDELLSELQKSIKPIWAIVTSATNVYASAALPAAGVPAPPVFITAEAVTRGKPDPEPYLKGAKGLELSAEQCIVFEDAPSGVKSGVAAGARVLAICTSHERRELEGLGARWIVKDLTKRVTSRREKLANEIRVKASLVDGMIALEIDES